jgi:hypothetical protein
MKTKTPVVQERIYNTAFKSKGRDDVVKWDVVKIKNEERVKIIFESVSSKWRQGVWLKTDKGIVVNGIHCVSVDLWVDTAPNEVECECFTKDGFLSLYNIWDSGRGYKRESLAFSSGMLIDELPNGRRYHCNDIGFETEFDKLVFRLEKTSFDG